MADQGAEGWVAPTTFRVYLFDSVPEDHRAAVVRVYETGLLELIKFGPRSEGLLAEKGFDDSYIVAVYAPGVWSRFVRVEETAIG